MMENLPAVIQVIDRKLQSPRSEVVFPIGVAHRKELRELRDEQIGNLKARVAAIKSLKLGEYTTKYAKEIEKELQVKKKICDKLNEDWVERVSKIKNVVEERKRLEEKADLNLLSCDSSYGYGELSFRDREACREWKISIGAVGKIALKEFEEEYKVAFDAVEAQLADLDSKYEEAINFGDLELVKELYYCLKSADKFLEKISKIEV